MNDFYVYAWLRPNGEPFYVGKGKGDRDTRAKSHNPYFMNVIAKTSRDGAAVKVVRWQEVLSEEDALALEIAYIRLFGRRNIRTGVLVNMTDGGDGASGAIMSDETLRRMRAVQSNRTPETLAKMSAWQVGKPKSARHRSALSAAHKGKPLSQAHRISLSAAGLGRVVSDETRAKISASNTGKKLSVESRAKIGAVHLGKIMPPESRAKMANDRRMRGPYSGEFKGVFFCTRSGKWLARITLNGKAKALGSYVDAANAARAYDRAAFAAWGADCYLNFPDLMERAA